MDQSIKTGLALCCLMSGQAMAQVMSWEVMVPESSLVFVATQNGAPVKGRFKNFSGDIQFDKNNLPESYVKLMVDTNSISTSYQPIADTLKTEDWLESSMFPQAKFETTEIKKMHDNNYQAVGNMTIRNHSVPMTINFLVDELNNQRAHVKGQAIIIRSQFEVGKGEWANTDEIKDEVKVDFDFSLKAKP